MISSLLFDKTPADVRLDAPIGATVHIPLNIPRAMLRLLSLTIMAGGALFAQNGGIIDLNANLTTINGANVYIDAASTITPVAQLTALTGGTFTLNGADDLNAFPNLATIDGLAILVEGGGSLSLPLVKTYTNNGYPFSESLAVRDSNSTLDLANLATITGNGVSIVASGQGSLIDVSGLTSFGDLNEGLSVTNGASAVIRGDASGVYLPQSGTLTNAGTIVGSSGTAVGTSIGLPPMAKVAPVK